VLTHVRSSRTGVAGVSERLAFASYVTLARRAKRVERAWRDSNPRSEG
jgi:hypothetical protein